MWPCEYPRQDIDDDDDDDDDSEDNGARVAGCFLVWNVYQRLATA